MKPTTSTTSTTLTMAQPVTSAAYAQTTLARCEMLSRFTEEPGRITRRLATPAMAQANRAVMGWMRRAGMHARQDSIGNVIGRYEGRAAGAKTLLLGSHLDTVRNAGKYDGILGVMIALICVEILHDRHERLPFAIEVLGFADEEGVRYHSTYLGSKVVAGTFDPAVLALKDADGIPMAEAIRAAGGDPTTLAGDAHSADDALGYCEVHIEQGPLLEARHLPVGVVSAIAGQTRISVQFAGEAGHAGTVPMHLRRDALCAAAEFNLAVEAYALSHSGLVATIGQVSVDPGSSNVIPGHVMLSLDVRHQDDAQREEACRRLQSEAMRICTGRHVGCQWYLVQQNPAVPCDPDLTRLWERSIAAQGYRVRYLPSGAGHDAVAMSDLTAISMLFVRCKGGIGHHPDESVTCEDVAVAIETLRRFLFLLADQIMQDSAGVLPPS